jgi:hypothetical protein
VVVSLVTPTTCYPPGESYSYQADRTITNANPTLPLNNVGVDIGTMDWKAWGVAGCPEEVDPQTGSNPINIRARCNFGTREIEVEMTHTYINIGCIYVFDCDTFTYKSRRCVGHGPPCDWADCTPINISIAPL